MSSNVCFTALFLLLFFQPLKSNKKVGSSEDEIEGALCLFCIFCTKSGPHYDQGRCLKRRGLGGLGSRSRAPYERPPPLLNAPWGTENFKIKTLPLEFQIFTVRISRILLEKNTKHREGWKLGRHKKASTLQTIFFQSVTQKTWHRAHKFRAPVSHS